MSDKNQSYIGSHPNIYKKFKNFILNKEMINMKNNNNNEDKKIDVSKVSGGVLSVEEKDGKFNVLSTRVLDSFNSKEEAQEAINNMAEQNWIRKFDKHHHHHHDGPKFPELVSPHSEHDK